jgi:hypothetical protein
MVKLATNGGESVRPSVSDMLSHVAFLSPPTQITDHDKVTQLSTSTAVLLVKLR